MTPRELAEKIVRMIPVNVWIEGLRGHTADKIESLLASALEEAKEIGMDHAVWCDQHCKEAYASAYEECIAVVNSVGENEELIIERINQLKDGLK